MDQKLSKKDMRIERKKRKAEAFLRIAEENEEDRAAKRKKREKTPCSSSEDSSDEENSTNKKPSRVKTGKAMGKVSEVEPKSSVSQGSTNDAAVKTLLNKQTNYTQLSETELKARRAAAIARKKRSMERPKLFLRPEYLSAGLASPDTNESSSDKEEADEDTPPLFIIDLQNVLLYAIQGNLASFKPRFCTLLRCGRVSQVMVINLNSLSLEDYQDNQSCFPYLTSAFPIKVPLVSPTQYNCSVPDELFNVPLSDSQFQNECRNNGIKRTKVLSKMKTELRGKELLIPAKVMRTTGKKENTTDEEMPESQPFSRVDLLLNPIQMVHENYPLPAHRGQYRNFIFTKDEYAKVTPNSPMFALDCEMCETTQHSHELTWVAVVDEDHKVIYESYVKPWNKITNYLTKYSGISRHTLENITTRLEDVQTALRALLPSDAILCGQSFNSDLKALRMFHPYVIDTSVIFNLSGVRVLKPSLRALAHFFLGEEIQTGGSRGHSPVEDSISTMKLVQHKLLHGDLSYGDNVLQNTITVTTEEPVKNVQETGTQEPTADKPDVKVTSEGDTSGASKKVLKQIFFKRPGTTFTRSLFTITKESKKSVLFVDREEMVQAYKEEAEEVHATSSDKQSAKIVRAQMANHSVCYIQLHAGDQLAQQDGDRKKEILKKLDERIKKLVSSVADKSFVMVIFPGRTEEGDLYDALGCMQITDDNLS